MSSPLALAAVTWVLKDILNEGVINNVLQGNVIVTARPPVHEPKLSTAEESQLNIFLYHVTPNQGWRNQGLPSFDGSGFRVANPPLALDLHYLLTAYDERDLHAEVLLGYAMALLHEKPVLTRKALRKSLVTDLSPDASPTSSLPADLRMLSKAGLADQIEAIKITPQFLNLEEMSKLWTGFQAPYRPSVAYLVTVVLIQPEKAARTPLPVLTVGKDDIGPIVQANLLPPFPTLLAVRAPGYQEAARINETIHLLGHHLSGASPTVILRHAGLGLELTATGAALDFTLPPQSKDLGTGTETFDLPDDVFLNADTRIKVDLSQAQPPANWAAGLYTVGLQTLRPGDTAPRTSNSLPLPIAPEILFGAGNDPQITAAAAVDGFRATTAQLKCRPQVRVGQSVSLVIGDRELAGRGVFAGTATQTDTLEFKGALPASMFGLPPGSKFPLRLRVDRVESILTQRFPAPKPPQFDASQAVEMPA
jgi:hypothetical protein